LKKKVLNGVEMRRYIPESGTIRKRSGFLWLPQTSYDKNGKQVIRWLEKAEWSEEYYPDRWRIIGWTDLPEDETKNEE
jgi:hypothetical protein